MPVTPEENAIAEQVVQKSKSEASVDTGRLKRSINKKVQRGVIVFREYFYGQYEDEAGNKNSTLEENAKRMMGGIPYRLERLDEEGGVTEVKNVSTSGRNTTYSEVKRQQKKIEDRELTERLLERRRKRDAEKDNDEDN